MNTRTTRPSRVGTQQPRPSPWRWVGFFAPLALLGALVAYTAISAVQPPAPERAVPFALPTTDGEVVSLDASLARGDTLLYFSMGPGCDGCFLQIPEIESALAQRGISFLPIMVDSVSMVAGEAARYGVTTPILIDADGKVAEAYGMLGVYGHSGRPSHSFALIRQDGTVAWVRHYAEMFVPAADFLAELDAGLAVGAAG